MIKSALPLMIKPVVRAFNLIINSGKFPTSWKDGIHLFLYISKVVNMMLIIIEGLHLVAVSVNYSVIFEMKKMCSI